MQQILPLVLFQKRDKKGKRKQNNTYSKMKAVLRSKGKMDTITAIRMLYKQRNLFHASQNEIMLTPKMEIVTLCNPLVWNPIIF